MPDKTIPDLTEALAIDENTLLPIDSGIQTYKLKIKTLISSLSVVAEYNAAFVYQTGDLCLFDGTIFLSGEDANTGNSPADGAPWSVLLNIPDGSLTGLKMEDDIDLPGAAAKVGGQNIVTSNANLSNGLAIIRALISGGTTPAIAIGEGLSVASGGTGIVNLTWDTVFDAPPVIIGSPQGINGFVQARNSLTTGSVIWTLDSGGTFTNYDFWVIAIGPRA